VLVRNCRRRGICLYTIEIVLDVTLVITGRQYTLIVTAGPSGVPIAFGSGYESGVWVVLVMILSDTIRRVYWPFLRKIQSENDSAPRGSGLRLKDLQRRGYEAGDGWRRAVPDL
jgi:hypothetical protein